MTKSEATAQIAREIELQAQIARIVANELKSWPMHAVLALNAPLKRGAN